MKRYVAILDTNILLRYLMGDDLEQLAQARELLEMAARASLYLPSLIIAEIIWGLRAHYRIPQAGIKLSIQRLLDLSSIVTEAATLDAMLRYISTNLDFADCLLAARAHAESIPVITFDSDFRKFPEVTALIPREFLAREAEA